MLSKDTVEAKTGVQYSSLSQFTVGCVNCNATFASEVRHIRKGSKNVNGATQLRSQFQ